MNSWSVSPSPTDAAHSITQDKVLTDARHTRQEKDGMQISSQRPESRRRRGLQSRRKPASQKQALMHVIKSHRILERGCYTKFYGKDDRIECFVAYCGKENSYHDEYRNDGSADDDNTDTSDDNKDDGGDDTTWKCHHDKDWVPKPYSKDQMHDDGNDLDSIMPCKQARGATRRRVPNRSYDDDDCIDNRDHDHVIPRKCIQSVHPPPQKIVENCYHCHYIDDDDHDPDAAHSRSYVNSANETIIHMEEDYPQTQQVVYVRRRKGLVNKRGAPRDGSNCPMSALHRLSLCSKEAVFPSWKNKKPRVIGTKQDKASKDFDMGTSPTYQLAKPHVTVMSQKQEELPLPVRPVSPLFSSNEVLKDSPKEFAEFELTSSLHSDAASTKQPVNTTDGAKSS